MKGIPQPSFYGGSVTDPKFTSKYPWVSPNTLWTLWAWGTLRMENVRVTLLDKVRFVLKFSVHLMQHVHWTSMENWEAPAEIRQKQVSMADKQRLFGLQTKLKCLKSIYIVVQKSKPLSWSSEGLIQLLMKLLGFVPLTWSWPWAEPTAPPEFLSRISWMTKAGPSLKHDLQGTPPSCSPPP